MKLNRFFGLALGVILLTMVSIASATTIVDTGTNGGGTPWSLNSFQWLAGEFSISQNMTVTSLEGYMWGAIAGSNTLTAAVYTDGGNVPGALLFSSQFTTGITDNWYGASGLYWALASGTYWAAFEVRPGDTYQGSLPGSAITPLAVEAFKFHNWFNDNDLNLGIRIMGDEQGAPVPEPGTMMLLGIGMAGLAVYSKRRKNSKA